MAEISLSDSQFSTLLKGYYAKKSARHMLSKDEAVAIAGRLNEKISLPFLDEQKEHTTLVKMVIQMDAYFYDSLPNEIYNLIHELDQGFDDSEASQLAARLSKQVKQNIHYPFLNEHIEYYAIVFMINVLINAMREGSDIDHAVKVTQHPRMMGDDFPFPNLF